MKPPRFEEISITFRRNARSGGTGQNVATWTFVGLPDADVEVGMTWTAQNNRATNTPVEVLDGSDRVRHVGGLQPASRSSWPKHRRQGVPDDRPSQVHERHREDPHHRQRRRLRYCGCSLCKGRDRVCRGPCEKPLVDDVQFPATPALPCARSFRRPRPTANLECLGET